MSSFPGIAVVTQTLQHLLWESATAVGKGSSVRIGPPEELAAAGTSVINLFLYHARPTTTRNDDLPLRDSNGRSVAVSMLPIELDYLISFTAPPNTIEAELLLGSVLRTLSDTPMMTAPIVEAALTAAKSPLKASMLAEPISIYPLSLSSDERSKLWSVFFQVPYRLSIEYRASTLLVAGDGPVMPTPPVAREVIANVLPNFLVARRPGGHSGG